MTSLRSLIAHVTAFVLGAVFILSSGSTFAGTNPPFVNPPSGSLNPTFTSIESANDTIVGGNIKVGNSIQPKGGGTTLNLDAANVAIKNNFEAKGDGIVKNFTANGNALIEGSLNLKGSASSSTPAPANFSTPFPEYAKNNISFPDGKGPLVLENVHIKGGLTVDGHVAIANEKYLDTEQFNSYGASWDTKNNPKRPFIIFQGDVDVANDLSADHVKAKTSGSWFEAVNMIDLSKLKDKNGNNVNKRNWVAVTQKCPTVNAKGDPVNYVLVSCSGLLYHENPYITESDKYSFLGSSKVNISLDKSGISWIDDKASLDLNACMTRIMQKDVVNYPAGVAKGVWGKVVATCHDPNG